jgi:hypothetical protein
MTTLDHARRLALPVALCLVLPAACSRSSGAPSSPGEPVPVDTPKPDLGAPVSGRPGDILDHPDRFLGHLVDLDIVEPLEGPQTEAARSSAEYGFYRVRIPDAVGTEVSLVPAGYTPRDERRYRLTFDTVLQAPLHVRGDVLLDPTLTPKAYVVRVVASRALDLGPPVRVGDVSTLVDDRYDRKLVEVEGEARSAFEVAAIGQNVWVSGGTYRPGTFPPPSSANGHVGILFAKKGAMYGHLGGYKYELVMAAAR